MNRLAASGTVRGVPADGSAGGTCWRAESAQTLCYQGQGTVRCEADAAQTPEDRIYTVTSGVFYIGLGDQFDGDKVKAYPPCCVVVLPGDAPHFHWGR